MSSWLVVMHAYLYTFRCHRRVPNTFQVKRVDHVGSEPRSGRRVGGGGHLVRHVDDVIAGVAAAASESASPPTGSGARAAHAHDAA